jgi:hypothetical protein
VPDACDLGADPSLDCNSNGILDVCEDASDCNENDLRDICEVFVVDCNGNGVPDDCDVQSGASDDDDEDGVPDDCEGACCACDGCRTLPEVECRLLKVDFGGVGTTCADEACVVPPTSDGECASAMQVPGVSKNTIAFDNRCVTSTETPAVRCPSDPQPFGADLWYNYEAPCTGTLRLSACEGTEFDAIMAVFGGPTTCTCELRDLQLACGDDTCGQGGGPPVVDVQVVAGRCYVIRLGGWQGARGRGELEFQYLTPCSSADLNLDGRPDLLDFAFFQRCFGRESLAGGCSAADLDDDGAVKLGDYALYFASLP